MRFWSIFVFSIFVVPEWDQVASFLNIIKSVAAMYIISLKSLRKSVIETDIYHFQYKTVNGAEEMLKFSNNRDV